ncbi:carbohydrate sulfotransferase 11-like [Palaemon carinicauda]|uniref:carbohydrate sulfotransferase 11-like n=1 Tax=Palaemon carinicauda TaxID=392227 RepID=UPI0035B59BD9
MARHYNIRLRGGPRSSTTRWGKALMWVIIIFVVSTYLVISNAGSEHHRLPFLQWLIGDFFDDSSDTSQYAQTGNMTWEQTQKIRVNHMERACKGLNLNQTIDAVVRKHILVDTRHKVLMCFVPKVACTSWKRIWFWLAGLLEEDENVMGLTRSEVHGKFLPTLSSVKFVEQQRKEFLLTYKKFLFARHPLHRLISAYRDKLEHVDKESNFDFHKHVGQEVESMMRGKVSGGHNITFQEFIRWVTPPNGTWTTAQQNEHWRPIVELCAPCAIQYDAVGLYENLQHEANETLYWIGAGELAERFPPPDRAFHASKQHQKYKNSLTSQDKLQFLRTYLLDFLLFGYNMP